MEYHEKFIAGDSRTKGSLFFYARPPPDTGCGNCMKQDTYSDRFTQFPEADTFKATVPTWDVKN